MSQKVVYQFDPKTGFITGTVSSNWDDAHPFLAAPNQVVVTDHIKATMTTEHPDRPAESQETLVNGGGWAFSLNANGVPACDADGNYILIPPPFVAYAPSPTDYVVIGQIKSGALDPNKDIHANYVTGLNRALNAAGVNTIPGTTLHPLPTRTCVSVSANLKFVPDASPAG